jgi:hypothetical protein
MKPLMTLLAVWMGIMIVPVAMADTITINDTTLVQQWYGNAPYGSGAWVDRIGEPRYATEKIDVVFTGSNVTFRIYTNYALSSTTADLALDLNRDGTFEKGVDLYSEWGGLQKGLYDVSAWYTSQNHYASQGWTYGGRYDQGSPKAPPVDIKSGTFLSSVSVSQATIWGTPTTYRIDVNLGDINAGGQWNNLSLLFGTALCANDVITGQITGSVVPEPTSLLFLGLGLVGLASFRKKFRK